MDLTMQTERSRKLTALAETLQSHGFSMSANDAQRMAQEIVSTEERAIKSFDERKVAQSTYSFCRDERPIAHEQRRSSTVRNTPIEPSRWYAENARMLRERATQPSRIDIQVDYDTPRRASVPEPARMEATPTTRQGSEPQQGPPRIASSAPTPRASAQPTSPSSAPPSPPATPAASPSPSATSRGEERVDLSSVFNFSKRA